MIPNSPLPGAFFLFVVDLVVTILSLLGSLLMFYLCLRIRKPFTLSLKFILAISIADFIYSVANLISNFEVLEKTFALCRVEANLRQCSFILSIFFSTCTAIASYKASIPQAKFNKRNFFNLSVTLGPLICFVTGISGPYLFPDYVIYSFGPTNCTISSASDAAKFDMLMVEMGYRGFPIIIGITVTLVGYLKAIRTIKEISEELGQEMDMSIYQLLWYPFVLMITFLPSVIDPIVTIYTSERPVWVRAVRMGIPHLIGFTNAVVYIIMRGLYQEPEIDDTTNVDCDGTFHKDRTNSIEFALSNALVD